MAKIVALEPAQIRFAREEFSRFYRAHPPDPPLRCARREFAAFPFAQEMLMRRHLAFRDPGELQRFLGGEAPRHVYHSAAYYRVPDHLKMDLKEWLGADLIFDLDADHLRGAEALDYPGQLALVKQKLVQLLDDFLFTDFAVDPAEARIVFSGNRGYHVHVVADRFQQLTSPERRELVDYIQGIGLDPALAILERREGERGRASDSGPGEEEGPGTRSTPARKGFRRLYPPQTPGWRGRLSRSVLALLARWEAQGAAATTRELEALGLPQSRARSVARALLTHGRSQRIRESLSLDVFPKEAPQELFEVILRRAAIEVQGETDAPVTTDIHRLIRLPGSLHGGTGFRAVPLSREQLDPFDPIRHAGIPDGRSPSKEVVLLEDVRYPFDPPVQGKAAERLEVPRAVALFLTLRGEAQLPPLPEP